MSTLPSPQQVSAAAHARLPHANPLSMRQMTSLVDWASAARPRTVLDIGCGPGSFALALAARADATVLAVDTNPEFLARARAAAATAELRGRVEFRLQDAASHRGGAMDLVACIGSSHALGTPRQALRRIAGLTAPGGAVLVAELVWTERPPRDYLEFLGTPEEHYWRLEDSGSVLAECGLGLVSQLSAARRAWDRYEKAVLRGRLAFAASLPEEQAVLLRERAQAWYRSYQQYGRRCLGFTAYWARPSS